MQLLFLPSNMAVNYNELLAKKVREIVFNMRQIFKGIDNHIYNQLTDEYEEELVGLCRLIPTDWSRGVYSSFGVAWDVIDAIDWKKIASAIDKYPQARLWFDIDVRKVFDNFVLERTHYSPSVKSSVMKICDKFSPIFEGINVMIKNPAPLLSRISVIQQVSLEYGDVLAGL